MDHCHSPGILAAALLVFGLVSPVGGPVAAQADPIADFYRGRTLIINVASSPGSGIDLASRTLARNLSRHIPGQPSVIVRNMIGGGGLTLYNYLYNIAAKDGTELGSVVQFPFELLFGGPNVKFDAVRYNWIGGPVNFSAVAVAWNAATPVRKAEDLLVHELIVAAAGATSGSATDAYVIRNILGFKFKVVLGYAGGTELDLAMIRGESQGRAQLSWPALKQRNAKWITDGTISILYQMGLEKNRDIPASVPLILDFAKTPEARRVLELKFATYEMGYPFFGPPGIPPARVAALRKAMVAALDDPATRADAAKQRIAINPVAGERMEAMIRRAHATPPAIVKRLLEASKAPK
jgi:tripartite-type tricarboxylate transporter receptor subunit TctC